MKIANKALWIVESRLREPVSLEELADELGVSAFHLARAFSESFGISLMRYVRRRRLAVAASFLVDGNMRIIDVALEAGYGSQEAFTRAFAAEMGVTPQVYRQSGQKPAIKLEARLMTSTSTFNLQKPVVGEHSAIRLVGLSKRYNEETSAYIPDQWAQFSQLGVPIPAGACAFGVCHNGDTEGNIDYFCGVEVAGFSDADDRFDRLTIPAQRYAKFHHDGHISEIKAFWAAIFNDGLTDTGLVASEGPELERYDANFDPVSGNGGYDVWIPVK